MSGGGQLPDQRDGNDHDDHDAQDDHVESATMRSELARANRGGGQAKAPAPDDGHPTSEHYEQQADFGAICGALDHGAQAAIKASPHYPSAAKDKTAVANAFLKGLAQ